MADAQVEVSAACARLQFIQCGPDCLAAGCGGACCDAPSRPGGCLVTVHESERERLELRGAVVQGGFIQPKEGTRGCPFKHGGLCSLHGTPDKPFGCVASPFTLNRRGLLVVRNRYKLLPCYRLAGPKGPAYRVFRSSLERLFGADATEALTAHLDAGGGNMLLPMAAATRRMLVDNDWAKHSLLHGTGRNLF